MFYENEQLHKQVRSKSLNSNVYQDDNVLMFQSVPIKFTSIMLKTMITSPFLKIHPKI